MSDSIAIPASFPVQAQRAAINPWFIAITVTLATFMELLDTAIANVALPHIAGGLAVSYDESTWVLTSYLVANAVVLPLSAWLSRVFGRKRYYMACVVLFTISSFLCGIAPSLGLLIFFRILQGVGGGGLAPVEQAILVDTFPASKRAAAFALYSMAIVTAPVVGPPLGGWITDNWSWRWVFFINIPIGIISVILTSRLVSDPPEFTREVEAARRGGKLKIDGLGILLIAIGFACLEVVLDRGQIDDWFESEFISGFLPRRHYCADSCGCMGVASSRPSRRNPSAPRPEFRACQYFLFLIRICLVRFDRLDSANAATALRLHRDGRRPRSRPRRPRNCGAGSRRGFASAKSRCASINRRWLLHLRDRHVAFRELRPRGGLSPFRTGSRATRTRNCALICPGKPGGLLLSCPRTKTTKPRASRISSAIKARASASPLSPRCWRGERNTTNPSSSRTLRTATRTTATRFIPSPAISPYTASRPRMPLSTPRPNSANSLQLQASFQGSLDCFTALGWIVLIGAPLALLIRKFDLGKPSTGH